MFTRLKMVDLLKSIPMRQRANTNTDSLIRTPKCLMVWVEKSLHLKITSMSRRVNGSMTSLKGGVDPSTTTTTDTHVIMLAFGAKVICKDGVSKHCKMVLFTKDTSTGTSLTFTQATLD